MKKCYLSALAVVAITLFLSDLTHAQWTDNQNAEYVIGQPDFSTYSSGSGTNQLYDAGGVVIDYTNNKLFVTDYSNNRVLRYSYPITGNQPTADRVFGTGVYESTQTSIPRPRSVAVHNGVLYVMSGYDHRITRYNNASTGSGNAPAADGVYGQTSYTAATLGTTSSKFHYPEDIFIDASGNLWVADRSNHRVLKFNDINNKPTNGTATADLVLGQTDFTSSSWGTTQSKLAYPNGVVVSGTTVWVADFANNRVLRFDNPTTNGTSANGVLGQSDYTSSTSGLTAGKFNGAFDVTIDAIGRLYVSDGENGRIMIFNDAASKSNGANADNLLGQSNFTTRTLTNGGQNGFYNFYDSEMVWESHNVNQVTVDSDNRKLLVTDTQNFRILQFAASSALPVELTFFIANIINNKVSLNWNTATEKDNYGFEIERGQKLEIRDHLEWEKIGFVNGHGNSNSPKDYSIVDDKVFSAGKYCYRLKQIDFDGKFEYSDIVEVKIETPTNFKLGQNFPNPFNPSTRITYSLPFDSKVLLTIYNIIGQEIKVLEEVNKKAGSYSIYLDATGLNSGVYIYKFAAGGYVQTRKMILAK